MKRICLAAIAIVILVPATAAAAPFTAQSEANYQAALSAWGATSPPGCATVEQALVPFGAPELDGASARATQPSPDLLEPITCVLWMREDLSACAEYGVMLHEVGHLLGHGHTSDLGSIMYSGPEARVYVYFCFDAFAERRRGSIDRWVERCSRFGPGQRRRECWYRVRTWRDDLRREWQSLGPPPTLP